MQVEREGFHITTDPSAVDIEAVHALLTASYWAEGIPRDVVVRAIAGSLPFSLFDGGKQIGFARVITDRATYGYLADVYVLEPYRGQGLGCWLIDVVMEHPDLQGLRRIGLVTRDAHALYASHRSLSAKVRVFIDALVSHLRGNDAALL